MTFGLTMLGHEQHNYIQHSRACGYNYVGLVFCVMFCRLLSFFLWSLFCLSFFDLWLLITPFVFSNFKHGEYVDRIYHIQLEIKHTIYPDRSASYFDLHLAFDKTLHRKLIPLKLRAELSCSVGVGSSCSACGTRRVTLVANPMISCLRFFWHYLDNKIWLN
jgi:hypothetical protein